MVVEEKDSTALDDMEKQKMTCRTNYTGSFPAGRTSGAAEARIGAGRQPVQLR